MSQRTATNNSMLVNHYDYVPKLIGLNPAQIKSTLPICLVQKPDKSRYEKVLEKNRKEAPQTLKQKKQGIFASFKNAHAK